MAKKTCPVSADSCRDVLEGIASTPYGETVMRGIGLGAVVESPREGDDEQTVKVCQRVVKQLYRSFFPREAKGLAWGDNGSDSAAQSDPAASGSGRKGRKS